MKDKLQRSDFLSMLIVLVECLALAMVWVIRAIISEADRIIGKFRQVVTQSELIL